MHTEFFSQSLIGDVSRSQRKCEKTVHPVMTTADRSHAPVTAFDVVTMVSLRDLHPLFLMLPYYDRSFVQMVNNS